MENGGKFKNLKTTGSLLTLEKAGKFKFLTKNVAGKFKFLHLTKTFKIVKDKKLFEKIQNSGI